MIVERKRNCEAKLLRSRCEINRDIRVLEEVVVLKMWKAQWLRRLRGRNDEGSHVELQHFSERKMIQP